MVLRRAEAFCPCIFIDAAPAAAAVAVAAAVVCWRDGGIVNPTTTVRAIPTGGNLGFFSDQCTRTSGQTGEASAGLVQPVYPCRPARLASIEHAVLFPSWDQPVCPYGLYMPNERCTPAPVRTAGCMSDNDHDRERAVDYCRIQAVVRPNVAGSSSLARRRSMQD